MDNKIDSTQVPINFNLKKIPHQFVEQILQFFRFQSKSGILSWSQTQTYFLYDGTLFTFKNEVFQRHRKDSRLGVRYEIVSNKPVLGEGAFGKVFRIKGTVTLKHEEHVIEFKKFGKLNQRRVVKVQRHGIDSNSLIKYLNTYELTKKLSHLSIKPPSIVQKFEEDQISCTTMKLITGRELFHINNDDFDGKDFLSTKERIELTRALLWALKKQVNNYGLIHRDIKPENIMVDLESPITVNIIDFDLCTDKPDFISGGSYNFYAPEIEYNSLKISSKSDVYSMGRVIALVWRVSTKTYNDDFDYLPNIHKPEDLLKGLFKNIYDLTPEDKATIEYMLTSMLANNVEQRFSIEDAIDAFRLVGQNKTPAKVLSLFNSISEINNQDIIRQIASLVFKIPYYQAFENQIIIEPDRPNMFFQINKNDRLTALREFLKNSVNKKIIIEELFLKEFPAGLSNKIITKIKELVLNELLFIEHKNKINYSFFKNKPQSILIKEKQNEICNIVKELFYNEAPNIQEDVTCILNDFVNDQALKIHHKDNKPLTYLKNSNQKIMDQHINYC